MSLIIASKCRDGIVFGCDTRTTIRSDKGVRYNDTTVKIVPFPNRCCVAFCGDDLVKKGVTVHRFLTEFRESDGIKCTINDLPLRLLNAFVSAGTTADVTLFVGGYMEAHIGGFVYRVKPNKQTVEEARSVSDYGASYGGVTDVCHGIMNSGILYGDISFVENLELVRTALVATMSVAKFWSPQSVGGEVKLYGIHQYDDSLTGWYVDNDCMKDEKADVNAIEKLRKEQIRRTMEADGKGADDSV